MKNPLVLESVFVCRMSENIEIWSEVLFFQVQSKLLQGIFPSLPLRVSPYLHTGQTTTSNGGENTTSLISCTSWNVEWR